MASFSHLISLEVGLCNDAVRDRSAISATFAHCSLMTSTWLCISRHYIYIPRRKKGGTSSPGHIYLSLFHRRMQVFLEAPPTDFC